MDPTVEKFLVAATGPVITAILALVVANVVTARAQARREAAAIRERLAAEMSDVSNLLYFELQRYWRAAQETPVLKRRRSKSLKPALQRLDDVYHKARVQGNALEYRLSIFYDSEGPAQAWHRLTDLLSVRYFLLWLDDPKRRKAIRERNAGETHSGLSESELNDAELLLETIREAVSEAIESLWAHPVDTSGRHLRHGDIRRTWPP